MPRQTVRLPESNENEMTDAHCRLCLAVDDEFIRKSLGNN